MQTKDGKPFTATTPFISLLVTDRQRNKGIRISLALIIAGISFLYLLPFAFAFGRKRTNTAAIFIVNLLFGWTLLGWVLALVWAVKHDGHKAAQIQFQPASRPINHERE